MEGANVPEDPVEQPQIVTERSARQVVAYLLMALFVVLTSVGAFLMFPPAGFIVGGINCGIYGYLLGAD